MTSRSSDRPRRLALASPQESATAAGVEGFERGGNALDAALATALSLAVVYPNNCALGGDLIALVRRADGSRVAINASGPAAAATDVEALRRAGPTMPLRGPDAITVPGLVVGLGELWRGGARRPWEEAFGDAIAQAGDGIPVVGTLAAALAEVAEALGRDEGCREVFFGSGGPLREGDLLRQPALARTLEGLAHEGADAFYRGATGRTLGDFLQAAGSPLDREDLARFAPELTEPLISQVGGSEVAVVPPNSQGFLLGPMLDAALRVDPDLDPLGPRAGDLARIFRASLAVREDRLGDPGRGGSGHRDEEIDLLAWEGPEAGRWPRGSGDTVAVVAADDEGNCVSLLQSLFGGFGAMVLDPATGVLFHNRGSFFSLDPGSPNLIAPGRRPAHTLAPCMVFEDGLPRWALATMGGSAQPQILAQLLLRLRRGDDPAAALGAPRWVVGGPGAGEGLDALLVEEGVPPAAFAALEALGVDLRVLPPLSDWVGHAQLIARAGDSFVAASDPRSEGAAIVRSA
ncbi:MAG TPA: gamma-glutamyltransferase [Solirubrobacterales bacterium]